MLIKLRILFTVLAALCLAVIVPAGFLFDFVGVIVVGIGALFFFLAMLLCKQAQEKQEWKKNPPAPQADFLHPKTSDKDEEGNN